MSFLFWNCRGFDNPWTVRQLRRWSSSYAADMVFPSETMISKQDVEALRSRLGFSNCFEVSSRGKAGGLGLFWKANRVSFFFGVVLITPYSWRCE